VSLANIVILINRQKTILLFRGYFSTELFIGIFNIHMLL